MNLVGQNTRLCEQQMWRNFFSLQNAIDFEDTVSGTFLLLINFCVLFKCYTLLVFTYDHSISS